MLRPFEWSLCATLAFTACESQEPGAPVDPDPDPPTITIAALTAEGWSADAMEMTLSVRVPRAEPRRDGADADKASSPIVGATVRVVDTTFGVELDVLQVRFEPDEASDTLDLVLPRAYDQLAVALEIEAVDARGDAVAFRQEIPRGTAKSLPQLPRGAVEPTVLSDEELAKVRADVKPAAEVTP